MGGLYFLTPLTAHARMCDVPLYGRILHLCHVTLRSHHVTCQSMCDPKVEA